MQNKFQIQLFDRSEAKRLPIHHKTTDYFEEFVIKYILEKYKIIIKSKWTYHFGIFYDSIDYKNIPEHILHFTGIDKNLVILPPHSLGKDAIKGYSVQFFIKKIKDNPEGEYIGFCEMMIDFIETFFLSNYKKITENDFQELRKNIDWTYLKSLPYPADEKDQRYI